MNAIEMRGIVKQYPLVRAVDDAVLQVAKGEIHSLLGENGAGKSTLMKILYGMCKPDAGEIFINGEKVTIKSPSQAISLGIGMVHQHFMLTPVMTVTENIVIGNEPTKGIFFDYKAAEKKVSDMITKYGFAISPNQKVQELSVGEQQRVEILKALYSGADILILDEPTAVLTPQEIEELFKVMRELKKEGKSIIIITHKLKETMAIADRISVLRDGKMVNQCVPISEVNTNILAEMMVGRNVALGVTRRAETVGEAYFKVENLNLTKGDNKILDNINITLHKGEILGLAGIEGNGQTELIEVLTGITKADTIKLTKDGKEVVGTVSDFINTGIGHIPEDRHTRGLVNDMSIQYNTILGYHTKDIFQKNGIFDKNAVKTYADEKSKEYLVKAPNTQVTCSSLSGGNQQKVIIARVFSQNPDVIIVAQPTRGVDVGAQEYIHNKLLDLRDEGKAILLISADLDEARCLSDRIAVIYDGKIVAESHPDKITENQLGILMTGGELEKEVL